MKPQGRCRITRFPTPNISASPRPPTWPMRMSCHSFRPLSRDFMSHTSSATGTVCAALVRNRKGAIGWEAVRLEMIGLIHAVISAPVRP